MKLSIRQLNKLIAETVQEENQRIREAVGNRYKLNRIFEEADPSKLDPERFPLELSQALKQGQAFAYGEITSGTEDGEVEDDQISASTASIPCQDLKPSQSSMNINKACNFAIAAILKVKPFASGPGGDLGAIISSDNHIMDGHHRWIASGMVDPSSSVGGFKVEFPAKQLIAVLNKITVGIGVKSGKSGTGGFDQFNEAGVKAQLQAFLDNPGDAWAAGKSRENLVKALQQFSGEEDETKALNATAKKMGDNLSNLTLSVPKGFPERPDMPVISKGAGDLARAIELLRTGAVDVNPPYVTASGETGQETKAGDKGPKQKRQRRSKPTPDDATQLSLPFGESKNSGDDLILERWHKMAGLLK